MTYAILAMILIATLVIVLVAVQFDEKQKQVAAGTRQMNAAWFDILTTRLKKKGVEFVDGMPQGEPQQEAFAVVVCFCLVLLCAACGLTFCTLFFLACFGACLHELAEVIMDVGLAGALHAALEPQAAAAQAA